MSAFLCSDVQTYAAALITIGAEGATIAHFSDVRDLAVTYRALNNYALRARYGDTGVPLESGNAARDAAVDWIRTHTPADCYQVLRCLRYQCSEGDNEKQPGWAQLTAACDVLEKLTAGKSSDVWSI